MMKSRFPAAIVIAPLAGGLILAGLWRATPRWQWWERNSSVVGPRALLVLAALVVWCITGLAFSAGFPEDNLNRIMVCILLLASVAVFLLIRSRLRPSHRRTLAAASLLAVSAYFVQCVPYPNVGLHFGYWAYPNRAIDTFLECPNVQSAELSGWNKDVTLEEFVINVTFDDRSGRTIARRMPFEQYPTREYILKQVGQAACRL